MFKRIIQQSKKPIDRLVPIGSDVRGRRNSKPVVVVPVSPPDSKEDLNKAAAKAKMVVECSDLLREKYELDIQIWSRQDCEEDDIPEQESLQRRSDAMFREIRKIVNQWRSYSSQNKWTKEEWELIQEISNIIEEHALHRSGQ